LLLLAHDPRVPLLGPSRHMALVRVDVELARTLSMVAGIARSNPDTPSALLLASMASAIFGDRLKAPAEQRAVTAILKDTEELYGWPTSAARAMLETAWHCA
jgi:hypothetical protein